MSHADCLTPNSAYKSYKAYIKSAYKSYKSYV